MKILMLTHFAPYPPESGVTKRIFHLLEETVKRHEVSILSFGTDADEQRCKEYFGRSCNRIVFIDNSRPWLRRNLLRLWYLLTFRSSHGLSYSGRFEATLQQLVDEEDFDLVVSSSIFLGYHRMPEGVVCIGDTHNVEYDNMYRAFLESKNFLRKLYYFCEARFIKREEIELGRKFDAVLATSERDLGLFRKLFPEQELHVIPNGVDLETFSAQPTEPEPRTMVFTGLMKYYPNEHGILYFLDEIFPLIQEQIPDARIYVVGAKPSRKVTMRASDHIIVTGYVKDVRPYVARAQVAVIPLLIGGGTRLKALEFMAMKKPIVSTTLGCEGIDIRHGVSALLADTPQEFADAVIRLFSDRVLAEQLVSNAYVVAAQGYSWTNIGARLDQVYHLKKDASPRARVLINGDKQVAV